MITFMRRYRRVLQVGLLLVVAAFIASLFVFGQRGFGDGAVKSAPLSFVSVQPLLFRRAALVLLRTGVAPLPAKQVALP